jgi:drug/metabolite transporter (DMT)-like permease
MLTTAAFLTLVYLWRKKPMNVPKGAHSLVWVAGIFTHGLPFILLFWGEQHISAGLGGVINGTVPIWTMFFGLLLVRHLEPFSFGKLGSIVLGILGLVVIFYPQIRIGESREAFLGTLSLTGMAISYGLGIVLTRKCFAREGGLNLYANLYQQVLASTAFLTAVTLITQGHIGFSALTIPSARYAILYLSCISSGIVFLVFYYLIQRWGAVRTSMVTLTVPVFALLLDFLFNGTVPARAEMAGVFLILLSVGWIQIEKRMNR